MFTFHHIQELEEILDPECTYDKDVKHRLKRWCETFKQGTDVPLPQSLEYYIGLKVPTYLDLVSFITQVLKAREQAQHLES